MTEIAEVNEDIQTEHQGLELELPTEREMFRSAEPVDVKPLQFKEKEEEKTEQKQVEKDVLIEAMEEGIWNKSSTLEIVEADLGKSLSRDVVSEAERFMDEDSKNYGGGGAVFEEKEEALIHSQSQVFVTDDKDIGQNQTVKKAQTTKKSKLMSKVSATLKKKTKSKK